MFKCCALPIMDKGVVTGDSKKEIVVKRLSAFKFQIEVNEKEMQGARASVIQKAPPAATDNSSEEKLSRQQINSLNESDKLPIQQVIYERIIEILLWKLIGREKLEKYTSYPNAPSCRWLWKVVHLSNGASETDLAHNQCTQDFGCFMNQVDKFLRVCAPAERDWIRFGWNGLSSSAILLKIYYEGLMRNFTKYDLQIPSIVNAYNDVNTLLEWEKQGVSVIVKRMVKVDKSHERRRRWPYFYPMDLRLPPPHRPPPIIQQQHTIPRLKGLTSHRSLFDQAYNYGTNIRR